MKILSTEWESILYDEVKSSTKLRIISPFLSKSVTDKVSKVFSGDSFEFVTRFKQSDFALGVSSIEALKELINKEAQIYGVTGLHSKVYIFDERAAVVTSANLTRGGLKNNKECGVYITKKEQILQLIEYFDELKSTNPSPLTIQDCEQWDSEIEAQKKKGKFKKPVIKGLKDYGFSTDSFNPNVNYFIKFLGSSETRVDLNFNTKHEIANAGCYYMLGFPDSGRPRKIKDDDVIFMARITKNPNDHLIFGRAIAREFDDEKDMATMEELKVREWMSKWPALLKVHDSSFINGKLGDCISLNKLTEEYGVNSYASTKHNSKRGKGNTIPKGFIWV